MSENIIQINNMNKWFGDFQVLKGINLEVKPKQKIVVCGPSGSGKSTLIRCINRLEEHQEGNIVVDGTELTEDTKNIEQIRAEVGMVFQQFNLFPHLSILDNCTLAPIWVKKMPKKDAEELALKHKKDFQSIDADIVWVSLGFPKQELFIDKVCEEIQTNTNFVGIGGVFDWVAGTKKKAPEWLANIGLEWLLRLVQDPKRLYKRYLVDNTLFIVYFFRQVLFHR